MDGLIERFEGTNSYLPTAEGRWAAIFYTTRHNRLPRPHRGEPAHRRRPAYETRPVIDRRGHGYIRQARLGRTG